MFPAEVWSRKRFDIEWLKVEVQWSELKEENNKKVQSTETLLICESLL